ncbi:HDOD domain-containing protein [Dasania marina]|uniref:HDOD domain-containing protein n=1 Tax=Dasania marina TaxID=471499 RepID=UPI0030DAC738|tara:strand:- start:39331 stop:40575 length:1245 start_codon:yes stop_codon:yes gene_type:complete
MESSEKLALIAQFSPFNRLDHELFEHVAIYIDIEKAAKDTVLFDVGDIDIDEYYLVQGEIALAAKDGRENVLKAGEGRAQLPIARLRPRMYKAIAASDILYFSLSKSVLDELQRGMNSETGGFVVGDMKSQAGEDGRILLHEFQQELASGRFVLPSLPETALKIREKADDKDSNLADIAALVNTDPAIAAKLLKTANSPLYRGVSPCSNTQAAISRLGIITTKQLVTSFAVLSLFKSDSHAAIERMERLWRQSIEVAAFSYVLAKHLPIFNEDEAMLAGVLHRIGELVIISFADNFYDLSTDQQHLDTVIMLLSGHIGGMVLEKWDFAPELVAVAREYGDWLRHSEGEDDLDYCGLVQVASLYATQSGGSMPAADEDSSIPAFQKIALSPEQTHQIFQEGEEQLAEIRALLNGG